MDWTEVWGVGCRRFASNGSRPRKIIFLLFVYFLDLKIRAVFSLLPACYGQKSIDRVFES
jgi:hypothetical protein